MSMIFAHAPVIVPSVLGRPLPFRGFLYIPLVLLHVSLILRLAGGDWVGNTDAWQWGGSLNEVASCCSWPWRQVWWSGRGRLPVAPGKYGERWCRPGTWPSPPRGTATCARTATRRTFRDEYPVSLSQRWLSRRARRQRVQPGPPQRI